jgi:hypothetical protein
METSSTHNCRDEDKTRKHIEQYGLSVIMIEATEYLPSFAYSIGLWEKFNHPEIICFGFSTPTLHGVINDVAELIKSGSAIEINKKYNDFFENNSVEFIKVEAGYLSDYFGYAIDFYDTKNFPALQLVWTDRNNKFPWEQNFEEEFIYKQPLLDRNTNFKFREVKNLATITTSQFINENKPITLVSHDNDGDWQFLTENVTLGDACIVALERIVKKDPTLNEVFNLNYGEEAQRDFIGDKWRRSVSEKDEDETDAEE